MSAADLYEQDFVQWSETNAELLRAGRFDQADIAHIAEEIEDMGKNRRNALASRVRVLLVRLLKHQFQPGRRSRSWRNTMLAQRIRLTDLLEENPSLKRELTAAIERTYPQAVLLAAEQTGIAERVFPAACPYTEAQVLDPRYFPE